MFPVPEQVIKDFELMFEIPCRRTRLNPFILERCEKYSFKGYCGGASVDIALVN